MEVGAMYISVVGAGECDGATREVAYQVGLEIAGRGHVLVCGGLGGVMDAAAKGAHDAGGITVGILPGGREGASQWLTVALPTGMGEARNVLVAGAGDALIAVGGGHGTLSEIALGIKMGKPVVGLDSWNLEERGRGRMEAAAGPLEAVALAERLASPGRRNPGAGVER